MEHISKILPEMEARKTTKEALTIGQGGKNLEQAIYRCKVCQDFHFVYPLKPDKTVDYSRVVPCRCVKEEIERKRRAALLQWCELPVATGHMTLDKFKLRKGLKGLEEAISAATVMAEGTSDLKFLTLMGDVDRGKTHLAIGICRRWIERAQPARYAYVPILLDELRRGFKEGGDDSYESRWERFLHVPLLALDDLGVENPTPWVQERLDTLIDYRLVNGLYTIITTNLTMKELPVRIADRLKRGGKIIAIAPAVPSITKHS